MYPVVKRVVDRANRGLKTDVWLNEDEVILLRNDGFNVTIVEEKYKQYHCVVSGNTVRLYTIDIQLVGKLYTIALNNPDGDYVFGTEKVGCTAMEVLAALAEYKHIAGAGRLGSRLGITDYASKEHYKAILQEMIGLMIDTSI